MQVTHLIKQRNKLRQNHSLSAEIREEILNLNNTVTNQIGERQAEEWHSFLNTENYKAHRIQLWHTLKIHTAQSSSKLMQY